MAAEAMSQDDDVERLFSWLQTPDIRYREFAGSREVTDAMVTSPVRANTREESTLPQEAPPLGAYEPPPVYDLAPGEAVAAPETVPRGPAMIAPMPMQAARAPQAGAFTLGAAGRGTAPEAPAPIARQPVPPPPPIPPPPTSPVAGTGLLGGTYREEGGDPPPPLPPDTHETGGARPLDSVFNRLAGGGSGARDPRDRLRHIPGLGPTTGRPR